jgi:hypothetical protein
MMLILMMIVLVCLRQEISTQRKLQLIISKNNSRLIFTCIIKLDPNVQYRPN